MTAKPPKKRTLKRKAQEKQDKKNRPKDVVVKVHKVPECAKGPFRHDRSQSFPDLSQPQQKQNVSEQKQTQQKKAESKASQKQKQAQTQPATSSKSLKRKACESDDEVAPLDKKHKADHTPSFETTAPISPKRKAAFEPEDHVYLEQAPANKKQKTEATTLTDDAEFAASPDQPTNSQPATSPFLLKDDGTQRTSFLRLPAEIRNDIYGLAMDERLHLNQRQTWGNENPLQKTCKQIRGESSLLFHNITKFQTNNRKFAYTFIKSRSREQRASLSSVRISVPSKTRASEHSLRDVRRVIHGFNRTFNRKGLKQSVLQMELPVYDVDNDKIESHWVSVETVGFCETMEGRRRNSRGVWESIRVAVVRPTDKADA